MVKGFITFSWIKIGTHDMDLPMPGAILGRHRCLNILNEMKQFTMRLGPNVIKLFCP
jgi:hypothetical protein